MSNILIVSEDHSSADISYSRAEI